MKNPLKSINYRTQHLLCTVLALITLPLASLAGLKDQLDEIPDYHSTLPHTIYVERQTTEGDGNAVVGEWMDIAEHFDAIGALEDLVIRRTSHTLTWAGTSDGLVLGGAALMRSGRVIKSMTILNAGSGEFDVGNQTDSTFYASAVATTTTTPAVVPLTNVAWNWTDGKIVVTPTSAYYGTLTVEIEYIDNPAPSYVTSEETLTLYAASVGYTITDTTTQETIADTIEYLSGGRNTVKYTTDGVPGIYVKVSAVDDPLSAGILAELGYADSSEHPAFTVGGVLKSEFYVGKYEGVLIDVSTGSIVANSAAKTSTNYRMSSLKMVDPAADITFDESVTIARQNGTGYHCVTNAEWAYLYLRSLSLSHEPRGNNSSGKDYVETSEVGTLVADSYDVSDIRTLTGVDYNAWSYDGTAYGVFDLNGNVWEWVSGFRAVDGELQLIPDNDAALATADFGVSSIEWMGIASADGSMVATGTALNLHWDASAADGSGDIILDDVITYQSDGTMYAQAYFNALTAGSGIVAPAIVKALGLYPLTATSPIRGRVYMRNIGERIPFRGGTWSNGSSAGVAALNGDNSRGYRYGNIGCRSAFVD